MNIVLFGVNMLRCVCPAAARLALDAALLWTQEAAMQTHKPNTTRKRVALLLLLLLLLVSVCLCASF